MDYHAPFCSVHSYFSRVASSANFSNRRFSSKGRNTSNGKINSENSTPRIFLMGSQDYQIVNRVSCVVDFDVITFQKYNPQQCLNQKKNLNQDR